MSELSDRLVQAVMLVLPEAYDRATGLETTLVPSTNATDWETEAKAAAVAALREVADQGDYVEFALNPQGYLRELADEIEAHRGAQ